MAACKGTSRRGEPCKAHALKDAEYCLAHGDQETREIAGFGGAQPGAGRPKNPRAIDVLRDRIEAELDKVLQPLFDALNADRGVVVGNGSAATGGAEVEFIPDHPTRIAAVRELLDRVYGKPKQTQEVSGPDGAPVQVASVFDLSKLSLDEKRQLLELAQKAADGSPGA